jgi:hypothetical protein
MRMFVKGGKCKGRSLRLSRTMRREREELAGLGTSKTLSGEKVDDDDDNDDDDNDEEGEMDAPQFS